MKKSDHHDHFPAGRRKKAPRPGLFALILCCLCGISAGGYAQQQAKYDVSYDNRTIISVLQDLKEKTGYAFLHMDGVIPENMRVSVTMQDATIDRILGKVLVENGFSYRINKNDVVITRAQNAQQPQRPAQTRVTGTVRDAGNRPLAGVTVAVKGTARGVSTSAGGQYSLLVARDEVVAFTFIGKKPVEVAYTGQPAIDVRMEDETAKIDQVVITGMFNRRLESETGSSVQFRGEQLREAGNQNILRSLANLDPSFMIMENLELGSDPNALPTIQMRGQSSFPDLQGEYTGNPNQPLFILDGFETTLEKVYDLDMNRVSTITILKDASAKAIYGSKAGNGVVVIETVRPARGEIRVFYSGTLDVEAPDLTGYNLMNAGEKLAFEKQRGMYEGTSTVDHPYGQAAMDKQYQHHLQNVLRGVDTYWLGKPLQVGFGQKHAISLGGGDDRILYGLGINFSNVAGVMKGSDRNTLSSDLSFAYTYKNLIFRNTVDFTINRAENSPYGAFSQYAQLNPYWIPYDENGDPVALLGTYQNLVYYNPLYNASLNTKNTSAYNEIRDNFQVEWRVLPNLRVTGRFSFVNRTAETDVFFPASHTMFLSYDKDSNRRGRYTKGDSKSTSYQADAGVNYSKTLGRNMFFLNATWNLSALEGTGHSYTAEGFGNDKVDDIAFAAQYLTGSTPAGSSNNQREVGVVGALNYSYDDRYLFDGSVRSSGSSMFGSDQRWGLFWALGVGWNLHKEAFLRETRWLDRFKIRGSVGYTGSQNFDPYQAKARYEYAKNAYDGGFGAIILGLPNDNLRWQRVMDYNAGIDAGLLGRLTLKFDYFISLTDDLLIDVAIPPSTGFPTYKENLGKVENRGFDASLSVQLWRDPERRGWLTFTLSGMHNRNRIKQISDTFEHRNNRQNQGKESGYGMMTQDEIRRAYTRPSTLYYEGQSMTAIWGVRSAGVNPMTGSELFYDLNGKLVQTWSALDQVVIGDTAPDLRGSVGLSAGYRGFTLSIGCSYRFGGQTYNTTLVDKLENTDGRMNLDRRILEAWAKPGDAAPYRKLAISSSTYDGTPTKPTSRFVMDDNEFYISVINAGYDFQNVGGLAKIGIERLKLSFYMNELLRFSSIRIERGTSYPFARNFSFSMQATF